MDDEEPHRHLSALPGWREFTALVPGQPGLLTAAEYASLDAAAKDAYDAERLDYYTRLRGGGTSVLQQVVTTGRRLTMAGRFTLIPTLLFPLADEWRGLVATIEEALCLRRHQTGTLTGPDRYLHQRARKMIGSLSHLIRGASVGQPGHRPPGQRDRDVQEGAAQRRDLPRMPGGQGGRSGPDLLGERLPLASRVCAEEPPDRQPYHHSPGTDRGVGQAPGVAAVHPVRPTRNRARRRACTCPG